MLLYLSLHFISTDYDEFLSKSNDEFNNIMRNAIDFQKKYSMIIFFK